MRTLLGFTLAVALLSLGQVSAQSFAAKIRGTAPNAAFTTNLGLEAVHFNLKRAFEKCHSQTSIVTGQVYPTLKRAEIEMLQGGLGGASSTALLAMAIAEIEGTTTMVRVWAPKPSFGTGYSFIATVAEKMAAAGSAYECGSEW